MKTYTYLALVVAIVALVAFSWPSEQVQTADKIAADDAVAMDDMQHDDESPDFDPDTVYRLDTASSTLEYEASRLASKPHVGTVALASGELSQQDGKLLGGSFVIDMTQMTEAKDNERFLTHIASEDFFNVEQYPTATFEITSIDLLDDGSAEIQGDLTILDVTNPIAFTADMDRTEDQIMAKAEFQIDRLKWGITYDSGSIFQQLGDRAIRDEIDFRLDLTFVKASE